MGFPVSSNQCTESIRPFFPYRDELTVYNGLVLKGNHIVITKWTPQSTT